MTAALVGFNPAARTAADRAEKTSLSLRRRNESVIYVAPERGCVNIRP